jgi:hypothetical protein
VLTPGTHKTRHVFHDAKDADAGLAAEIEFLANVEERDFLRGGDEHGAVDARRLEEAVDRQVLVTGAWWRIDDQEVEIPPGNVHEELLNQAVLLRSAPDDGIIPSGQHELHTHNAQILADPHGLPTLGGDVNRFVLYAHHLGDARAADICVHKPDGAVGVCGEAVRDHRAEGGLPDAALAREHEDLVLDTREACGYHGDVGVGAFRCRCTYGLVGAAGAVVCEAGLLRLWARTVFLGMPLAAARSRKGGVAGRNVPGSGATSCGAALIGASKSTCVGSSSEGAIAYEKQKMRWLHG